VIDIDLLHLARMGLTRAISSISTMCCSDAC
jgi:hypothetical protein